MPKINNEAIEDLKKEQKEKKKKITYEKILILIAVLAVVVLIIVFSNIKKQTQEKLETEEILPEYAKNLDQEKFKEVKNQVRGESEIKRVKIYLGDILDNINLGKYDEVYTRLDDTYKKGYFPKQEVLEDYLKGEFPKEAGFKMINFERIGEFYIFTVDILSAVDSKIKKNMQFVFKEEGYNDYKFSFSKF